MGRPRPRISGLAGAAAGMRAACGKCLPNATDRLASCQYFQNFRQLQTLVVDWRRLGYNDASMFCSQLELRVEAPPGPRGRRRRPRRGFMMSSSTRTGMWQADGHE
jgi:hypothetical protein